MRLGYESITRNQKPANVLVLCAVAMVALLGMASLAIDGSRMFQVREVYKEYADGASLAGAMAMVSATVDPDHPYAATSAATRVIRDYLRKHPVNGEHLSTRQARIDVGRAEADESGHWHYVGKSGYTPDQYNAVRVNIQSSSIRTVLGSVLGLDDFNVEVSSTAMIEPNAISFAVDLSQSMLNDSRIGLGQLQILSQRGVEPNLFEVWASMPNDPGDPGYTPSQDGPCFGSFMKQRGYGFAGTDPDEHLDASYDAALDPGLIKIEPRMNTPEIESLIRAQGYSDQEVQLILDANMQIVSASSGESQWFYDWQPYYYRPMGMPDEASKGWWYTLTIALEMNWWNSGLPGGKWETMGDNGTPWPTPGYGVELIYGPTSPYDDHGENLLPLIEYPYGDSDSDYKNCWQYYASYVANQSTYRFNNLRWRFGIKTFMDFLLQKRPNHADTPGLANTPIQPLQSVKDAAAVLVDEMIKLDKGDMLALESFATYSTHEVDMLDLDSLDMVLQQLGNLQAGHYSINTNVHAAIRESMTSLTSRPMHNGESVPTYMQKRMVILTDGLTNTYIDSTGQVHFDYESLLRPNACTHARNEAMLAARKLITIDTITVGSSASLDGAPDGVAAYELMDDIANIGGGTHYHVEGTIEEMQQQLDDIFESIGGSGVAALIE